MKFNFFILLILGVISMTSKAAVTPLSKEQLSRSTVKVAAVQITGNWNWHADKFKPDSGEKVLEYIDRAATDGADLVVFPELLLGMFKVPSPTTEKISAAAAKHNIYVIAGCFEILEDGGYTNSSLVFDRQGKIIGRYCKMHPAVGGAPFLWPPKGDDPEWTMKDGQDFPVFDLDFGRIGILTCYDGLFSEPFRILSLKGAEILIWPNARGGAVEDYIVKTAMTQNHVHMICTNKAIGAGTMIAEWPGRIDQITTEPGEQYIVDTLDLNNLRQGRKYSRQFFQRFPEKYSEIIKDYKVSDYYVNMPNEPELPIPSKLAEIRHTKGNRGIQVEPVINGTMVKRRDGLKEGLDLYRLAFRMSAPWMEGSVELRLPEILHTELGMHYIDHYSSNHPQLSELKPFPEWRREPMTGALYYDCDTQEGVAFGARVTPKYDEVELEFYITNKTGKTLDTVSHNPCLDLKGSPQFDSKFNLKNLFAVYDSEFQDLTGTTPTFEQIGRDPWLIILTQSGKLTFDGPKDSKTTWWRVDQIADENLMAAQSKDGQYLIGYTWDREDQNLMTNGGNPCLHTGPGAVLDLENDQTAKWYGKVYLLENDPDQLIKRYQNDQDKWKQDRK